MSLYLLLCFPDKKPELVGEKQFQERQKTLGASGVMTVMTPAGIPAIAVMPVPDSKIDETEDQLLSDYFMSLACAYTALGYDCVNWNGMNNEVLKSGFMQHVVNVGENLHDTLLEHGSVKAQLTQLTVQGALNAHQFCCKEKSCEAEKKLRAMLNAGKA
jgi:hypothetical protein